MTPPRDEEYERNQDPWLETWDDDPTPGDNNDRILIK